MADNEQKTNKNGRPVLVFRKEHLEQAKDLFAYIIQEHMKDNRCVTHIKIFKQDGRLKILEVTEEC